MRMWMLAERNRKEMLRDLINLAFGIGFPLVVLVLLSAIQKNIPVNMFELEKITPGIAVFGLSFLAVFSGMLIAKDRSSSFLMRLFASPLTASDFILGYILPLVPIGVAQSVMCFLAAFLLGLPVNANVLLTLAVLLPACVVFIAIGLLSGSLLNERQVGLIAGAVLTNLSAWLSGTWFDISLVGGWFKKIADVLPFVHAVEAGRAALAGDLTSIFPHLWWVIGYAVVLLGLAILAFAGKMKSDAR